jgi:hypothetical protein
MIIFGKFLLRLVGIALVGYAALLAWAVINFTDAAERPAFYTYGLWLIGAGCLIGLLYPYLPDAWTGHTVKVTPEKPPEPFTSLFMKLVIGLFILGIILIFILN